MSDFSFDEWAHLYRLDPEEFERKRTIVLEAEIMKAPIARRNSLRLLQWQCDAVRVGKTPLASTVALTEMMLQSSAKLQSALTELNGECNNFTSQVIELEKQMKQP